jgi:hypothetical protein
MGFFNPWFLGGLAAVGLPVWLHLLRQHRSQPLPFSSLMFWERRTQSSVKHRRLRYLLLLALRCAFLALLALAFANPYVNRERGGVYTGRKLVIAAIDNSFSMRQGNRLATAKQQAAQVLGSVRPQDRGLVMALGSQIRLMSDQTNDIAALRAAVESVQPTDERGAYAELSRAVRTIAQSAKVPVELHLFSDMQKSSLPDSFADLRLGEGVKLIPHPAASQRVGNLAVESVKAPGRVYDPKKARVQATIVSYGGAGPVTRRAHLLLNGRELESKDVEVPANGRATVDFVSMEAPFGLNRGEVRLDSGDAFADDDHYFFSVEHTEPRRIMFVHDARGERDLLYFKSALDATSESAFQIDAVTPDQAVNHAPGKYAFVVLSNVALPPGPFEDALKSYVRTGGSVLIALGSEAAVRGRVPVIDQRILQARYSRPEADRFQTAGWMDNSFPSVRRLDSWGDVKFYSAVQVDPGTARVAARLTDQTPLLLEKQIGEGRVVVFASTFDNIANDFPLHASFVPFVEQTAHYLGHLDDHPANMTVGSYYELRNSREQGQSIEVLDPRGARALSLAEAAKAQNVQLLNAGYYEVHRPGGRHELIAVNPDRRESDLDVVPAETLVLWQNTGQGSTSAQGTQESERKPSQYWWAVLALALLIAIAESVLGNRHLSIEKEPA